MTLCACRLSKGCISNIPGMVEGIKLQPSGFVKGDVELTKSDYVHTTTTTPGALLLLSLQLLVLGLILLQLIRRLLLITTN